MGTDERDVNRVTLSYGKNLCQVDRACYYVESTSSPKGPTEEFANHCVRVRDQDADRRLIVPRGHLKLADKKSGRTIFNVLRPNPSIGLTGMGRTADERF